MGVYGDSYEARSGGRGLGYLLLLVAALLVLTMLLSAAGGTSVQMSIEHARDRHGQDADDVYNCYQQHGPLISFWNAATGRCAHVVKPDDQYGLVIESADDPVVTAFKAGRKAAEIINYLLRRGFTVYAGP